MCFLCAAKAICEGSRVVLSRYLLRFFSLGREEHRSGSKIIYDLVKRRLPPNTTEEMVMSYITQVTGFRMKTDYNQDDLEKLQYIVDLNRYTIPELMSHLRIGCDELMMRCRWGNAITDCQKLIVVSRTYSGRCCSFNIQQKGVRFLRKRATMHGANDGLSIIVKPLNDDKAVTAVYSNGVKLLVHRPDVFPSETTIEKLIPAHSEVLVRIRPTETTCSNQVRQLSIEERNCLFPEERQLRFFSEYNDENCDIECQILGIVELCDCIPYYFIEQSSIPICNFTSISCLVDNYDKTIVRRGSADYTCQCPASCENVNYDVQTNSIPIKINNVSSNKFFSEANISDGSVIHIYLNSQVYRRLRRDLLTNIIALISNFGSSYSLFIGMSIVSVFEILYFFTFIYKRNLRKIKEEDKNVMLFRKRLDKISFKPWKIDEPPIINVLN